uniref:Leucine rich repeat containing 24 n=1 Tax=Paramormyrops kingsleyae TaxID=1676925 RepID=A0A3B3RBN1_9TELE|nr:leucine-rich repeat-containing protein 24-like [Paramormyrops kingsleyae]XP_023671333.1 leucine-rich repeat-containing protein 24-like [Paramormyrops kingsleyae]
MAPPQISLFLLGLLALTAQACPSRCRCYSLTVECGSIGLRDIPEGVPPSTQTVFLQDNAIGQVHQHDLSQLGSLLYLYLQNNGISVLDPGAFRSQGRLLELALNGNRIHLLSADVLEGLSHLRVLYLAGNQITRLQDFTFRGLQRLQELHLQENSLEVLGEQAMLGLGSLALLDLSRNSLRTLSQASLHPLVSLQVLRITDNPWRCDCALHWLRGWMDEEGRRLLSLAERRLVCAEPPRLSRRGLSEVPPSSLVCIPPSVQLEPSRLTVPLGESLRVSCRAVGYPQPQVIWRKVARGRTHLTPQGLVQEVPVPGAGAPGGVTTAQPASWVGGAGGTSGPLEEGERFDPDTGSGMLFLSNVTVAHAGRYECEASNPGGVARVTFHLSVNLSSAPSPPSSSSSSYWGHRSRSSYAAGGVSPESLYDLESMDFGALGVATQAAIGVGISLLALTALLLVAMIYSQQKRRLRRPLEESVLYINDYSDGPTTFAQLEEYRDERGHEMYVLNRSRPVLPDGQQAPQDQAAEIAAGGQPRGVTEGEEADPDGTFLNQGLLFDTQVAYEIHC